MVDFHVIAEKVHQGIRLTEDDAVFLFEKADLLELGQLADFANQRRNGRDVFYNINRHINPTNVCAKNCKFCAFSRKPGDEGAYEYSIEDILNKAQEVVEQGATEIHMVGGLHPRWRFDYFLEIISSIKQKFPALHIKAFTAVEIDWLAAKARLSIEETLIKLRDAGLGSMPGGGAEIFHPEIRSKICDTKTDANRWIEIHRTAHRLGLRSNCTMLYGHIEKYVHRVDHMRRLRELQDETEGFNVFIPLAFQPLDNNMGINHYTDGEDDLRTIAVARLYLDNFRHIKSYWIMLGQDVAQIALNFGANDLDGTVVEEKISRMAGGRSGMAMARNQMIQLVQRAGRNPVERDTLYRPVLRKTDPAAPTTLRQPHALSSSADVDAMNRRIDQLLYRAVNFDPLSSSELVDLAKFADLIPLAQAIPHHALDVATGAVKPATELLSLDLARPEFASWRLEDLQAWIQEQARHQNEFQLLGLKSAWSLCRREDRNLSAAAEEWKDLGLRLVGSSLNESELDLTNSELYELHSSLHRAGIPTIAKLEINASIHPEGEGLFWDRLIERGISLARLATRGEEFAQILVVPANDVFISPCEYLRAIVITRLIFGDKIDVAAPFEKIPTIRDRKNVITAGDYSDPAFKITSLLPYFGAMMVDEAACNYLSVQKHHMEERLGN